MNELIPIIEKPILPTNWDYSESVEKIKGTIYKLRFMEEETIKEIWIAHEKLASRKSLKGQGELKNFKSYCEDIGITHATALNWFKECKLIKNNNVHFSSKTPEWYTPQNIIDKTQDLFGVIDLDPCSDINYNIPAKKYFRKEEDGLSKEWHGRIYMNPPYGRELVKWTDKLKKEYETKNVVEAIALVPSRTDTGWFRELNEYPRCFIWGRLRFSEKANSAPFPSMVVYLGNQLKTFVKVFKDIGDIYKRMDYD